VADPNAFYSRDGSPLSADDGRRLTASYWQYQLVVWSRVLLRRVPGQCLVGHDHERSSCRQRGNSKRRPCVPNSTTQSRRSQCRTPYRLGSGAATTSTGSRVNSQTSSITHPKVSPPPHPYYRGSSNQLHFWSLVRSGYAFPVCGHSLPSVNARTAIMCLCLCYGQLSINTARKQTH